MKEVPTMHLLLGWRTRWEAEIVLSGNSVVRTGLAWAEGMCSLQDSPLSLPQTQPRSTATPSCLPACCTVLAPALSRQGSISHHRNCSCLWDERSPFWELPESCHWITAPSTDTVFMKTEVGHVGPSPGFLGHWAVSHSGMNKCTP